MKLTMQSVVVVLNAQTNFCDNLLKFTLHTIWGNNQSVMHVPSWWFTNLQIYAGVFQDLKKLQKTQPSTVTCLFFFSFWRVHWFYLGYSRFAQVNDSPRASVFPAGEADFGQAMYRSLERSPQDTRNGFDLYSARASFAWPRVDLARPLRRVEFRPFFIISFEFVKVCGMRFSS